MSLKKLFFLSPQKSLRAMLTMWFLIFSIVPLAFITGYSLIQFEKVYSDEMLKRLNDNFIVITKSVDELKNYLKTSIESQAADDTLVFNVSTKNIPNLKKLSAEILSAGYVDQVSLFGKDGQLIVEYKKDSDNNIYNNAQMESGDVFINQETLGAINEKKHIVLSAINEKSGFDLIAYSVVFGKKNIIVGYIEELIRIDQRFIENLKKRFNLDVTIFNKDFTPIISTVPDFLFVGQKQFSKGREENVKYMTIQSKDDSFALLIKPFEKDQLGIRVGLATSKTDVDNISKKINKTVFSVVGIVILFILIVLWMVSRSMFKPLTQLMNAVKKLESGEADAYIASNSETEIGELTKSFNNMSKKVTRAQAELTAKIKELEYSNKELQEAQAQLVHTTKMGSLGQVVAGVAHELNNPIGFIYSNMDVLKDYIDKLTELIRIKEKNEQEFEKLKKEYDLDYIIEDVPRLIQSCQDGAKRVRDIVLNLKNFSRSDELERKEYNLEEGIDSTLQILKSEFKTRITIHKEYGKIPSINCYAGQINQVFMNILSNAIQAIDDKGDIWIKTEQKGLEIFISIRDSGKGIAENIKEKIFDPFFTTKPVGQGTGLGLSISYGIINKHNGQIIANSQAGQGTEFIIVLPLITPQG